MALPPFASDLGAGLVKCNVGGAHRFKYFSNAFKLPSHSTSPQHSPEEDASHSSKRKYRETGAQTEECVHVVSANDKEEMLALEREKEIMKLVQLERERREQERREQEAQLPPMKDAKSLEAYRKFLEENELKDFSLREKELDDAMERRLLIIEEDLQKRYSDKNVKRKAAVKVRALLT